MATSHSAQARQLAARHMSGLGRRWMHVRAVGNRAEAICVPHDYRRHLADAAWLHDIGYAPGLEETGFHAIDGARFLRRQGWDDAVVSLVAYHSGAVWEAAERGLTYELDEFAPPPEDEYDVLVLIDMTTSPAGKRVSVGERLAEIQARYSTDDPVHRAVSRSAPFLREAAARAAARLGLTDVGGVSVL